MVLLTVKPSVSSMALMWAWLTAPQSGWWMVLPMVMWLVLPTALQWAQRMALESG